MVITAFYIGGILALRLWKHSLGQTKEITALEKKERLGSNGDRELEVYL